MASKTRPPDAYLDDARKHLDRASALRVDADAADDDYRAALLTAHRLGVSDKQLTKAFPDRSIPLDIAEARRADLNRLARPWSDLSRAEAVERLLREGTEPMRPHDIANALSRVGLDFSEVDVNSTLQYLAKWRRAERLGFAQWQAVA